MINMATWPELVVDVVDDLELDPHNVRLELSGTVTESDIAQDLFSNENVLSLVDGIAKVGYLTHEIPIVVRRGKKLFVVEGNRRIAALKCIQNPYLAPGFTPQVTRIANAIADRDALRRISVKLAPNDDEANRLIGAIHTGTQRKAWSPNRQAAFFQAQLDAGKSAKELIEQYPTVDVKKFILRSRYLEIFRSATYTDLDLKSYISNRKFPVSILERLYPNNDFLRTLGLAVDDDYNVTTTLPDEVFGELVEKIVRDIKDKKIDTRKLNKSDSDSYKAYLAALRDLVNQSRGGASAGPAVPSPGGASGSAAKTGNSSSQGTSGASMGKNSSGTTATPSGGATGVGGAAGNSGAPTAGVAATPVVKPKAAPKRAVNLDTADLTVPSSYPRSVGLILAELSRINITIYPNAAMDLLRTFLEKSIKSYADQVDVDIRTQQNVQGFVYLSHCLKWLETYLPTVGHRPLGQVAKKLAASKVSGYYSASTDALNAINHNHKVHAEPEDVRSCWSTMHELMKVVLAP